MSRDESGVDVLLMPAALCTGGLAHIVREEMMAIDAKSKLAANLLRFRFIGVFIVFFFPVLFVLITHSRKFGTKFRKNSKELDF